MIHPVVARTSLRLAVGVLFATALIGCGQTSTPSGSASMPAPTPAGPALHIGVTSDGFLFNTPARMCHVPLIVVGTVSAYGTAYWNTPNGARQADVTSAVVETQGYRIYTPIRFSTFQILLDFRHQPTREYVMMGGQVGQDTYADTDYPSPPIGQRYVMIFGPTLRAGQSNGYFDVLFLYEVFPIDGQGNVLLQQTGIEQGHVYGQNVTISLSALTAQLATCSKV